MGEPSVWGDFEVHEDSLLGRGGMGAVYKARQRSLNRWVAVKVFDPARVDPALAPGFLEKFRIEIQALARLRDPRIVTIHQAGENDGRVWFAMELIDGETVEERLSREGAFPEREAARVGAEVARALEAAFREGIVHRDVKPGNIFLLRDGSVKLADFGLARSPAFAPTALTDAQAVACTPAYTAPEEAEGGASTDPRSDLYSLGCVLYEMATERPPFVGTTPMETLVKHATEPPRPPRALNPAISREFEEIVLRCLAKDPAGRYGSPGALAAALEKLVARAPE
ncbi:MAG TPA: serine/threonine-protein kinase, partial [Planctomycetota bacterium]|nr:serine/threonine-protein kinase [Planctomycetota bacterium]